MIETFFEQDVKKAVKVQYLDGNVFSQDNSGNKIGVRLFDNGEPQDVSGTISANVIRSDGVTVAVSGSSSNNAAWVILPQSAYAVPGVISIVIKLTSGSSITTICAIVANVYASSTDSVVDPGTIIPSVETLIAAINAAVASIPADYSSLWESLAKPFDATRSIPYYAGEYATYNGNLYRFVIVHSGSWASADVKKITVGESFEELTENNSANLWKWGNVTVDNVAYVRFDGSIPAGTYTLSGEVVTNATARGRIWFYKDSVITSNLLASPAIDSNAGRGSATFTIADTANIILVGLVNSPTGYFTEWKNIQLETGLYATEFAPYIGAIDGSARKRLANNKNMWTFGDAEFTYYKDYDFPLAAGTYVFSGYAENTNNPQNNPSQYRVSFYSDSTEVEHGAIGDRVESSFIFTLSSAITKIRLVAANVMSNATTRSCKFSRISLLKNDGMNSIYFPPSTCVDDVIQYENSISDTICIIKNLVLTANRRFDMIRTNDGMKNLIIECKSHWTGTETDEYHVPEIRFFYIDNGWNATSWFVIGGKDAAVTNQWRMPPYPGFTSGEGLNHFKIAIDVPSGLTLTIDEMTVKYDNAMCRPFAGLRVDTHLDYMGYPSLSVHSMNAAMRCGASHCIVIPKVSSDGVWFAYHDDTFEESSTILRNADGSAISGSGYNGLPFNQIPWSYLSGLDSGIYRNAIYAGTHLMKIETFYEKCNKAGIHPVFSVHPNPTQAETQAMYTMAKMYNLLDKLTLLPDTDWFTATCYPIFGNSVEMYKMGLGRNNTSANALANLLTVINNTSGLDKSKVCIALWIDLATESLVETIVNAGYRAGLHAYTHTTPGGRSSSMITGVDYSYWQKRGVTVFTDGYNPNNGLNW